MIDYDFYWYWGVYLLIKDHTVVYVGQTSRLQDRLYQHKDKDYDRYHFFRCHPLLLNEFEEGLIERFMPKYNRSVHAPCSTHLRESELRSAIKHVKWLMVELENEMQKQ